ncbi:MAG: hydroxypyruvate isomerase family protein [Anaerolineae bacterium]
MPKLSVCVEMFWRDLPLEERIARVARLGYPAFEFWGWKNKDIGAIQAAAARHNLPVAALCLEPGMALVRRSYEAALIEGMRETAVVAEKLGCRTIIATTGNTLDDETFEITRRRVVSNLRAVAAVAEDHGLTIVVEPLNTLVDHHGYWLAHMAQAVDIVQEVGSPAVKILMDLYHQQIMEGNLIANLTADIADIGHFHTAGVPGRHELVGGELDYRGIFRAIDATGYDRYVGLEFSPTMDPDVSLRQALELAQG